MKRAVGFVAGVATLGVAVYLGSRLWAQAPSAAPQAPAQTKVALVNTINVLKSYHKFKTFDDELKALAKPFEKIDKELRDNLAVWKKESERPDATPAQKDKALNEMKARQRQIEDNALEAKKVLAKRNDEQLVHLYKDVNDAIQRYAVSNGFHIVLQFHEPAPQELLTPPNIQRKLQGSAGTGCCVPLYSAPGLDITNSVIANLNATAGQPAGGVTPAGGRQQ